SSRALATPTAWLGSVRDYAALCLCKRWNPFGEHKPGGRLLLCFIGCDGGLSDRQVNRDSKLFLAGDSGRGRSFASWSAVVSCRCDGRCRRDWLYNVSLCLFSSLPSKGRSTRDRKARYSLRLWSVCYLNNDPGTALTPYASPKGCRDFCGRGRGI